ncbi:MAG: hypothetical protein LBQ56_05580, partial [Synergistaceae bacterium]|nr:hypothetical protein [Synergistaceae bacterium]
LQDRIDIVPRPFAPIAASLCSDEDEVVERVADLASIGVLRRIGASVDHRRAGYVCNSLIAWNLSGESADSAARRASANPWASHCYLRRLICSNRVEGWPYNLYVMAHATGEDEMTRRERALARELGGGFISMRTVAEYKKIPYIYAPQS